MSNLILLAGDNVNQEERVSSERFYKLESRVEHIDEKVSENNDNTKRTAESIDAINISLARLTTVVETLSKIEPRISKVEDKVNGLYIKAGVLSGGITVLVFLLGDAIKRLLS